RPTFGFRPSTSGRLWTDVDVVQIVPVPEGPAGPVFVRPGTPSRERPAAPSYLPIDQLAPYAPEVLPAPLDNSGCDVGGSMVLTLAGGSTLTYGPCARPASINHLWAGMLFVIDGG